MGVGKKAGTTVGKTMVKREAKKTVEGVTEDIPIVGGVVDDQINSGPMDRMDGEIDDVKKDAKKTKKKTSKKIDKATDGILD